MPYFWGNLAKYKMKIAGRKEEIALLQSLLQKDQSEFVAVYGRRRIGKTFLVREVYRKQLVFECGGLHERAFRQQLENFWLTLADVWPDARREQPPGSWLQAFTLLKTYLNSLPANDKKVVFLDEISWFETPRSGFLAALDNFWNQYCTKRSDIILVICGSAASWIIQKVINDRGGLHNRITRHIRLMPFTLQETSDFLEMNGIHWTKLDVARMYMCVGGVPFYLTGIVPGYSVPRALDELFFLPQARLKNEFENLYAALFKNSNQHEKVVRTLALKNKGLSRSEIIEETGLSSGGGLTTVLEELIACGFIRQIYPVNKSREDALFRLIDEFSLFYYKFMHQLRGNHSWMQTTGTPGYHTWSGYAFENLCLKHTSQIKEALGIRGIITSEYSWQWRGNRENPGAQIDMIIDRSDNCINVLEIKFHDSRFEMTKVYAARLLDKVRIFKAQTRTTKNIFVTLLTASGASANEHYLSVITNELKLEDLF